MKHEEIVKEVKMTYYELQDYLLEKYGSAKYDYFTKPECKYKNKKVSRTKEGLYCHHMDEDEGGNLSNPPQARQQCFEWQKKERLVYCNLIEHLILHMKINILRQKRMLKVPKDISDFFTTGGVFLITMILDDMYMNGGPKADWMKPCYEKIKENYNDFISLMKSYFNYIEQNYECDKSKPASFVVGAKVILKEGEGVITNISPFGDSFILKLKSGEEKELPRIISNLQYTYKDYFDYVLRKICSGKEKFYEKVYEDILNCEKDEYSKHFKVDFHSTSLISVKYGFSQYASIRLNKRFNSRNADEYISKAFPIYCGKKMDLNGKALKFWSGNYIPIRAKMKNHYYFIRVKCSFKIKDGYLPFIQIKGNPFYKSTEMLTSSELQWCGVKYKKIKIENDEYTDEVTLTFTQTDYKLFHEHYNVYNERILDGCYFSTTFGDALKQLFNDYLFRIERIKRNRQLG